MDADRLRIIDVTPDLARRWLANNPRNRRLRDHHVRRLAADMTAGHWSWNGSPVVFATGGTLLDGQHRLAAIALSGCTIRMVVISGVAPETQDTVDTGVRRTFADVLQLRGEKEPALLAALARRIVLWHRDVLFNRSADYYVPTNAEMTDAIAGDPSARRVAIEAKKVARRCDLPGSVVAFTWWLFARLEDGESDAAFFFARLADWQGLMRGDPVYALRSASASTRTAHGERSERFLTAITIKAWNAYRDGEKIGSLRFRAGGAAPERFPVPR